MNVIVVNWWKAQQFLGLPKAYWDVVRIVENVGDEVGSMLKFLKAEGLNLDKTLLVGHSLGAHVMGFAGKKMNGNVNYIVGMNRSTLNYYY